MNFIKKVGKKISGWFKDKKVKPYEDVNQLPGGALSNRIQPINSVTYLDSLNVPIIEQYRDVNGNIKIKLNGKNLEIRPVNARSKENEPNEAERQLASAVVDFEQLQRIRNEYEQLIKVAPEQQEIFKSYIEPVYKAIDRYNERSFQDNWNKIERVMASSGQLRNGSMIDLSVMNARERSDQLMKSAIEKSNYGLAIQSQMLDRYSTYHQMQLNENEARLKASDIALRQEQQRIDTEIANNQMALGQLQSYTGQATNLMNAGTDAFLNASAIDQQRLANANATKLQTNLQNRNPFRAMARTAVVKAAGTAIGAAVGGTPGAIIGGNIAGNAMDQANNQTGSTTQATNQWWQFLQNSKSNPFMMRE